MERTTLLATLLVLLRVRADLAFDCPSGCVCKGLDGVTRVYCNQIYYFPLKLAVTLRKLDLSRNNYTALPSDGFINYQHLEELNVAYNNISHIDLNAFRGLNKLRILNLRENHLEKFPWKQLSILTSLQELHIGWNRVNALSFEDFRSIPQLRTLSLDGNALQTVPSAALWPLTQLEVLTLSDNNISYVTNHSFFNFSQLQALSLANNHIRSINDEAFFNLVSLEILELQHNELSIIPSAIKRLPALKKLSLAFNHIHTVLDGTFSQNPLLVHPDLLGNPVLKVGHNVFANLTQLKILILPEVKELSTLPDLNGTSSLEFLRVDRSQLSRIPKDLCLVSNNLKTMDFKSNYLTEVPNLFSCAELRLLQLSGNRIRSVEGKPFRNLNLLHDLLLNSNHIQTIPADAFYGLEKLEILNLMGNRISSIHPDAFLPLKHLIYLNVAENSFPQLPSTGLHQLRQLLTYDNPWLKDFPPASSFPHINTLRLSYAYHCCQFSSALTNPAEHASHAGQPLPVDMQETVLWLPKDKVDLSLWVGNNSDLWPAYHNLTHKFGELAEDLWGGLTPDYLYPSNLPQVVEDYFEDPKTNNFDYQLKFASQTISCTPQPGPFMPCEDLFDWWTLRCGVWIVFLLSMLGNGSVVLVLVFSRTKMDVPRFLVCNLACSDFCMGIYLGFLAVVDASTLGEFKQHALQWQFSVSCRLAGFLGVLSSELSVITLAVITLERNYAITHAMHLNKRLSLKHAAYIMFGGWSFATFTASLPLFGISDYRKFAICLPFDIGSAWSLAYVVFLMSVNGIAFLILMGCYLKMYCAIRGSQAWNSNDSRIAKRMALLVFTDFICWAPIAFFSLTAAFGLQLVSLEEAKIFTVFVLPLNSCANPFLYAILTKQFKKDCVLICKAIEESRVTRGIGRCRHSSNFSNRQTPANTNSAVDQRGPNASCSCSRNHSESNNNPALHPPTYPNNNVSVRLTGVPPRTFKQRLINLLCASSVFGDGGSSEYVVNSETRAIAEIQKKNQKKHHGRALSLSSDNFSSSRSDSWRHNKHMSSLKMLEKPPLGGAVMANIITRKASQDSNLSSSRNDSSATTPSTSTWRVSRSSVSSDSAQKPKNVSGGGGANGEGHNSSSVRFNLLTKKDKSESEVINNALVSLTSGRPKAKLKRQAAVTDDKQGEATQRLLDVVSCGESTFTPRKLSTISSTSCSLNHEPCPTAPATLTAPERWTSAGAEEEERSSSLMNVHSALSPLEQPRRVHSDHCFPPGSDVEVGGQHVGSQHVCCKCKKKQRMYYSDYVLNNWLKHAAPAPAPPTDQDEEQRHLLGQPPYLEHDV